MPPCFLPPFLYLASLTWSDVISTDEASRGIRSPQEAIRKPFESKVFSFWLSLIEIVQILWSLNVWVIWLTNAIILISTESVLQASHLITREVSSTPTLLEIRSETGGWHSLEKSRPAGRPTDQYSGVTKKATANFQMWRNIEWIRTVIVSRWLRRNFYSSDLSNISMKYRKRLTMPWNSNSNSNRKFVCLLTFETFPVRGR